MNVKLKEKVSLLYGQQRVVLINTNELRKAKKFLQKSIDSDILEFMFSFDKHQLTEDYLLETFFGFEQYQIAREMDVMFFIEHIKKSTKPKIFRKLKEKYPVNIIYTS
jgi:hypothetical protein